jgi:DNA-binding transcriptional MerR regulator
MEQTNPTPQPEQTVKTRAGEGLGIAALILGILALIVAFIPCVGLIALVPGIIAVILSIVALVQANEGNGAKGIIIAALVVSILATSIAVIWGVLLGGVARDGDHWRDRIERMVDSSEEESLRDLGTTLKEIGEDMEKRFSGEEGFDPDTFEWGEEISDEEFEFVMQEYEKMVEEMAQLAREAERGEMSAMVTYSSVSLRAASLAATLFRVGPKLTEEQKRRLEEVNEKYEKALDKAEELED